MPRHNFKCSECEEPLEIEVKITEDVVDQVCPACGHKPMNRVFSKPHIKVKGGFYSKGFSK